MGPIEPRSSRGEEAVRRDVESALQRAGHDAAAIEARTFPQTLKANELIERQIVSAEKRRDQFLRQLDSRRESLARRARAEAEKESLARSGGWR